MARLEAEQQGYRHSLKLLFANP